jgi:pimeloyl-ACP methyl ester carboxylesterase
VEWLRSSYRGEWSLFQDRPDVLTPGRYVRVPSDWPDLPVPHYLGSTIWLAEDELQFQGGLGEKRRGSWDNGSSAVPLPIPTIVGSSACLSEGEPTYPPESGRNFYGGWVERCFESNRPMHDNPPPNFDILDRANQITYASILALLYVDPASAALVAQAFLGPTATITMVPNGASTVPGSIIGVRPDFTVVWISGTTTPEQAALQVLYAPFLIQFLGPWSTSPFWFLASLAIESRIDAAGVFPILPIVLVGHSYGGAIANILAARYRFGRALRRVQSLTFGAPKSGDLSFQLVMQTVTSVQMQNVGDPVCSLPPGLIELLPLIPLFPLVFTSAYAQYASNPGAWQLANDGSISGGNGGFLAFDLLSGIISKAVANMPQDLYPAHAIAEYVRRLQLNP